MINLQNLNAPGAEGRTGTVEIRLHNGTLEAEKILPWISLWQQILLVASEKSEMALPDPPPDRDMIDPSGDIVALAQRYLPGANNVLLKWLEKRRRTVMCYWLNEPSLKRQLEHAWIRWMTRGGIHRGKGYPEDLPDDLRDAYLWMLEISGQFQADVAEPMLLTTRRILRISLNDLRRSCGQAPFDNRRAGNLFGQVRRRRARVGAEKVEVPAGSLGEELRRLIVRVTRSAVPELEAATAIPEGSGSSGDPRVSAATLLSTVG